MFIDSWAMMQYQMNQRVKDKHAEAESKRLARLVRGQSSQALSWQFRWMMCGVGLRLVALGARIESRFLPPAQTAESRVR